MIKSIELSVIAPMYNEQELIGDFLSELGDVLNSLKISYEIIIVDDGSTDSSIEKVKIWHENNYSNNLIVVRHVINRGHTVSLNSGLKASSGKFLVTMDSDLQHPPKVIKEFWSKRTDFPVIVARQVRRESSMSRKILAKIFYPFVQIISGIPIDRDVGDFRLIRRDIMVAISQSNLYWKPIRFLLPKHKVSTLVLDYDARERINGKSKHNSRSLLRFAFNSMLYSTNRPILLSVAFSVFFSLLSIVHVVFLLYWYASGITIPGWTTITFVLSSGFSGLSLAIAVLSIYLLKVIESLGFGDQNFGINIETLVRKSNKQ